MSAPRLRVALVFPGCHREGGVERVVRELARRVGLHHDVAFVGDRFDPIGMDGVRFLPVEGRDRPAMPVPVSFRRRAARTLAAHRFDVVTGFGVECPPGDVAVVQSVHRAWLGRSGPVPTPWGSAPAVARYAMPRHLTLLGLERSYFSSPRLAAVMATSAGTAEEVVTGYGVAPDRVAVMPNGFDHHEFNLAVRADQRADQRARMGADAQIVILFVANELHRKGFATLVEAVARVGDPRLRVDVVGRASTDGYAAHIHGLGLEDRVRWHGAQRDVAPWYAAADLCILPTQYEPFGNVIVESLATGTPVITTEVAGASSAVRPDVNGLLQHDPLDADELARLLRRALDDDRLATWSASATTDLHRFDWDVIAVQFEDTLTAVADRRR